jgi:hypothetical protein
VRQKAKEIACPDCLRKRLRVFRVDKRGLRTYFVTDPLQKVAYELEPWQFFVLEVLTECDSFSRLSLLVEDRYGQAITQEDLDRLFALIAGKRMFGVSVQTAPLLVDYNYRRNSLPTLDSDPDLDGSLKPDNAAEVGNTPLPAAVRHALESDGQTSTKGWALFDPTRLLRLVHPPLAPFRRVVYLIPFMLVPALILAFRYHQQFADDLFHWFGRISFLSHVVLGLLTVNLLATVASALVAFNYGVTVSAFCIVFYFAVWPRFMVRVGSVEHLHRRARVWYYAAPLLVRLAVFSLTMLVWFNTRDMEGFPAKFSLSVAVIAQISFLITAIPLMDSNGYRLLATFLDAPKLRQRATIALANKLRGKTNDNVDNNWLVVYALASALFIIAVIAVFFFLLGEFLESRLGGGAGVLALLIVGTVLLFRIANAIKKLNLANARATRFANWRKRETHEAD